MAEISDFGEGKAEFTFLSFVFQNPRPTKARRGSDPSHSRRLFMELPVWGDSSAKRNPGLSLGKPKRHEGAGFRKDSPFVKKQKTKQKTLDNLHKKRYNGSMCKYFLQILLQMLHKSIFNKEVYNGN